MQMAILLRGVALGDSTFRLCSLTSTSSSLHVSQNLVIPTSSSSSSSSSSILPLIASKFKTASRNKIICSAVQESSTTSTTAATTETKEEVKEAPKAAAVKKAPAKAPAKALPQMMEEEVIPSLKAILEAQEDLSDIQLVFEDTKEVNEMWAGLGYYRRARFLLEGAKKVVAEGGRIPKTASMLQKIPGIGDYTSGAIASIAFKEAVPVVDGNVIRVIARLRAVSTNPKDSVIIKRFWEIASQLVDSLRPGDFNQAFMELGATVCTPTNPNCSSCPASEFCHALSISKHDSSAAVTDYPVKGVKVKQRSDFSAVCVVELLDEKKSNSKFILVRRPDEGLLAGLWEFPSVLVDGETVPSARREAANRFLKKNLKIDIRKTCKIVLREDVGEFVHIFSHIRLKLYVELLVLQMKGEVDDDVFKSHDNENVTWKCVDSNSLSSMGLTTSVRKVYNMVQKFKQKRLPSNQIPIPTKKRTRMTKRN